MKKRILTLLIVSILLLCASCGTSYTEAVNVDKGTDYGNGYFTIVAGWNTNEHVYRIVYANDTKVKYLIIRGGNRYGITPLYNSDGTLQVYSEN